MKVFKIDVSLEQYERFRRTDGVDRMFTIGIDGLRMETERILLILALTNGDSPEATDSRMSQLKAWH